MASLSSCSLKQEPESPLFHLVEQDSWYNASDNVAVEVEFTEEVKSSRAEHASKLLQDLDQWVKEEESFPDWLEEKIDLPIFDDLPPPAQFSHLDIVGLKHASSPVIQPGTDVVGLKPPNHYNTNLDLAGMKSSLNNTCGLEVLGMKQLPPQTIVTLDPLQYQVSQITTPPPPPAVPLDQTPVLMQELDYTLTGSTHDTLTPPDSPRENDLVFTMLQEMQPHELDELVRMRVESLVESPVETSCSSLQEENESIGSPSSDSCYSDPEWNFQSPGDLKTPKRRRVLKPYSRTPPEEKRLRKKEQNKNAATRYRLKKKQEIEEILGEEKQLQQKNEQLRSELTELGREIKYLKNLMRDLFRAKGLVK